MQTPARFTFDYLFEIGDRWTARCRREAAECLLGATPAVELGGAKPFADRMPKGVELAGLSTCELGLRAAGREGATVEWASLVLPEALLALIAPGDELRLVRPTQADLALRLRRGGRLLLAAGALLADDAGPTLRADDLQDTTLRLTVDGDSAIVGATPVALGGFVASTPGPRPRSPIGRAACVAVGTIDPALAAQTALLLHHGPFRTLPWVRQKRPSVDP